MLHNSKTQNMTKLKTQKCDNTKTQIALKPNKLQMWHNSIKKKGWRKSKLTYFDPLPLIQRVPCIVHLVIVSLWATSADPRTNERPGTDLRANEGRKKKLLLMAQNHTTTDEHGNSMTESAQWGQFSEKYPFGYGPW